MDQRLKDVAEAGDVNGLYSLIQQDPFILNCFDQIPFIDTPLHIATMAGQTHFALEIANLKPSFARKLNQTGFSPVHLALAKGSDGLDLVRGLIEMDNELVRLKGREGRTPLHEVAVIGNTNLLREFLSVCPKSVEDLTVRRETALHLSVKGNQFEAFRFLMKWLERNDKEHILQWKDDEGNSILHMAAKSTNHYQVVSLLLTKKYVILEVIATNLEGLTALDVLERVNQASHRDKRYTRSALRKKSRLNATIQVMSYLRRIPVPKSLRYFQYKKGRDSPNDARNVLLVVAVLIATATYQAGLSPPGGVWQDDATPNQNNSTTTLYEEYNPHVAGLAIMGKVSFLNFALYNTLGFCSSLYLIFILTMGFPMQRILGLSLISLFTTYLHSLVTTSPWNVNFIVLSYVVVSLFCVYILLSFFLLPLITARFLNGGSLLLGMLSLCIVVIVFRFISHLRIVSVN